MKPGELTPATLARLNLWPNWMVLPDPAALAALKGGITGRSGAPLRLAQEMRKA